MPFEGRRSSTAQATSTQKDVIVVGIEAKRTVLSSIHTFPNLKWEAFATEVPSSAELWTNLLQVL